MLEIGMFCFLVKTITVELRRMVACYGGMMTDVQIQALQPHISVPSK